MPRSDPSSAPCDPPKALRDGRYVLVATLGHGAQGSTWDAVDRREGRPVAIKQFDVRGARAWKDVELAEREARVLATLAHPKLPGYVEHFEEGGVLYLVMEKIEGTPLSEVHRAGPMPERDVLRLLREADEVLGYLHERPSPMVHRDLKPSNVIRRPDGSFAFVDFGAVRERLRPEGGSTVVGTFGYMAPEQFQGRAGPGSDVYSAGAMALALLTGEDPDKLPHKGLAIDVGAAIGRRVSPALRRALEQMLEVDPDRRPTRIAPLLGSVVDAPRSRVPPEAGVSAGRGLEQQIREDVERRVRKHVDRAARHVERQAARHARQLEQHAQRQARHFEKQARHFEERAQRKAAKRAERAARRRAHPWRGPLFVTVLFLVGLTIAEFAVALALQVVVPLVLRFLSLFIGPGLRRAATAVSRAGGRAHAAMGRSRSYLHGEGVEPTSNDAEPEMRARVASDPSSPGVRVDPSVSGRGDLEDTEDDRPEATRRAR